MINLLIFCTSLAYAIEDKQITILPTIKPPQLLPVNGEVRAQYWVTNHLSETITLKLKPQPGVEQVYTGLTSCASEFYLATGQSCYLNLKITGKKIRHQLIKGPVLCQTKASSTQELGLLPCYQPTKRDEFNVMVVEAKKAVISVRPSVLTLYAHSVAPDQLLVKNHSDSLTAKNVKAVFPDNWEGIIQDARDCQQIAPGQTCKIYISVQNGAKAPASVWIKGSNTETISLKVMIQLPMIEKINNKKN